MQLEFHQLDRRWEHLRVRQPLRQRRLMASLAESGQQTPIVVVVCAENRERYLVIDGHKRIAALQQLGRDTVEVTVWAMSEAEALLLERSLRLSPQESALEQGWLLTEMEQRFSYTLEELGRRFDRSTTWVSRRLGLVEVLPEAIQQQVREGKLAAQLAMKYLVPVARVQASLQHAASRATLCRLAGRHARSSRARPRRAGTVFEDAAAGAVRQSCASCPGARPGDGRCHSASCRPAAGRSPARDDWPATGPRATRDRKRAPRVRADDGTHRKGTGRATC